MAVDLKYGRVQTERGTIGEDEPVVVFRARDKALPETLLHYQTLCRIFGSPGKHLELIQQSLAQIRAWQEANAELVHVSRSDSFYADEDHKDH